jgi:KilA-N domain
MPPTTCYGYSKRYKSYEIFKKNIIRHAKQNGVIINETNELARSIDDFIKVMPKAMSQKRPCSSLEETSNAKPMSPKRLCISSEKKIEEFPLIFPEQQLMAQAQVAMQEADAAPVPMVQLEQPMADAAPVPLVQPEQPMAQRPMQEDEQLMEKTLAKEVDAALVPIAIAPIENAELLTQIEELRETAANSASANAITPPSAHLPNANGGHKPLVLNGLVIEVDPVTFMVNATQMCKAGGKLYANYSSSIGMTEYIYALSSVIGIPITELTVSNQGGRPELQGTMVHRRVALYLAQRISPLFAVQVTGWLEELFIENSQLSTQIEELRATTADGASPAAIAHPCSIASNAAREPLVLNGLVIEVDPVTFMVNATMMCKAAGKLFGNYRRLDSTEDYLQKLSSNIHICILDLIKSNRGGDHSGTMVHRLVAYDLASWLSGDVKLQFYMWNDELLLTGRVELGNEMNLQQLENVWRRKVQEKEDKASADVKAEQDRCQELELQLATIQEAQQLTKAAQEELMAIKTRKDLEAAIQFQARATAPTIASYKEGDNVLYLARIDETKFKYGHTKNLKQRLEAHTRPGAYPTFELVWIVKSNNGVASEDQVHAYVKKTKIGVEYGNQREVVLLESVDALQRMINKMQKCCRQQQTSEGSEVVLRRIKAKTSIKIKKIDARVDMEKIKADLEEKKLAVELKAKKIAAELEEKKMDVGEKNKDREMKKLQMVFDGLINFDQFLLIK